MDVPNAMSTCAACLAKCFDAAEGVARHGVLMRCKNCLRFQKPQSGWVDASLESRPLLALCLRKIKGLASVSVVDAAFMWTEEHSKRVKVRLVVQREVAPSVVLRQTIIVEFVVQNKMCEDCHALEANVSWNSVVQVRQKVAHKRTFLYLEQVILKHQQDARTVKIEAKPHGIDFYFGARNDAIRFVDFIEAVVPIRSKTSKKLISQDQKSNVAIHHHTFSVEIVPICKNDLVILPKTTARKLGCISPISLCLQVSDRLKFIDPLSCQVSFLSAERFFQNPVEAVMNSQRMVQFVVLDVEMIDTDEKTKNIQSGRTFPTDFRRKRKRKKNSGGAIVISESGKNLSANHETAIVEVARENDFGVNDRRMHVRTHLGRLLKSGDIVLGYDLASANFNQDSMEQLNQEEIPDVVLVKKHFPKNNRNKKRKWKLKSMAEAGFGMDGEEGKGSLDEDREMFMQEVEEDEEMRMQINLYKNIDSTFGRDSEEINEDAPFDETLLNNLDLHQSDEKEDADDDL